MCPRRGPWSRASRNCCPAIGWSGGAARSGRKLLAIAGRSPQRELDAARKPKRNWIACCSSPSANISQSDVPLGVWLSGGLDSSTLVHYAAAASSSRLKTFSITFRGRSFDETRYLRQVADQYGTEHTEFDLNPEQDLPDAIHELAYYFDEPNADSGALPVWFLSRMTKAGTHCGAQRRRRRRAVRRIPDASRQPAGARGFGACRAPRSRRMLAAARRWPVSDDKIGFEYKLKRFLEGCLMPAARAHVYWSGTFGDAEKRALVQRRRCRRRSDSVLADLARGERTALQAYPAIRSELLSARTTS